MTQAKLVLATTDALDTRGGEQFAALAEHLASGGHDVVLISPTDPSTRTGAERLRLLRWPSPGANRRADGIFLWRLLRDFRPDAVAGRRAALNWTMTLGWLRRVPVRLAWDDTLPDQWIADRGSSVRLTAQMRRRGLVYRCATRVIGVSAAAADRLRSRYDLDARRIRVLLNGVPDHGLRHETGAVERVEIVCVGRLEVSKNHALVLDALALMRPDVRERCRVRIIGDGRERARLEALLDERGLRGEAELAGKLPEEETLDRLRNASIFVHPSRIDNCPFVLIEAMSLGVPIVATRVGGVPEVVGDGCEGVLVDDNDAVALARSLEELVMDPDRRRELGEEGRRRFLRQFEMSRWVDNATRLVCEELSSARRETA